MNGILAQKIATHTWVFGSLRTSNTFHFMFDGTSTVVRTTEKSYFEIDAKRKKVPFESISLQAFSQQILTVILLARTRLEMFILPQRLPFFLGFHYNTITFAKAQKIASEISWHSCQIMGPTNFGKNKYTPLTVFAGLL